jgi:hypothetical protein
MDILKGRALRRCGAIKSGTNKKILKYFSTPLAGSEIKIYFNALISQYNEKPN